MSKISARAKELRSMGDHETFLKRIQKTLYYGRLPNTDRLSLPVTELASELFSEPRTGRSLDRLHYKDAAHISRQACVSPCSFVLAMLYLERLKACNPEYLQCVAPSELFLVSLMISSKFLNDYGEDGEVFMDEWAASGGITVKELIDLEREFLDAIQWDVFVKDSVFWEKLSTVESRVAIKQGSNRGHFTYTELNTLLAAFDVYTLLQFLSATIAIIMTTYTAGILTIVGSMFIVSHVPGNCLHKTQVEVYNATDIDSDIYNSYESFKKPIDAVDVLKTSILLASIKTASYSNYENFDNYSFNDDNDNKENITWDWWNSSTMDWLSESSKMMDELVYIPDLQKYTYDHFVDMSIASAKFLDLEDQLHKGTKMRLQDLLERSWHKEWTDSIVTYFFYKPLSYFQEFKV